MLEFMVALLKLEVFVLTFGICGSFHAFVFAFMLLTPTHGVTRCSVDLDVMMSYPPCVSNAGAF